MEPTTAPELPTINRVGHAMSKAVNTTQKSSELDRIHLGLAYQEELLYTLKLRLNPVSNRLPDDDSDKPVNNGHIVDAVTALERNNSVIDMLTQELVV